MFRLSNIYDLDKRKPDVSEPFEWSPVSQVTVRESIVCARDTLLGRYCGRIGFEFEIK